MKSTNTMKFDIQMFADSAANVDDLDNNNVITNENDESTNTDNADSENTKTIFTDGTNDKDSKKIKTKAFSERLKQEKQKVKEELEKEQTEKLNAMAKSKGFNNWEELENFEKNEKMQQLGIKDSNAFESILNDAIENNPVVKQAKNILREEKEKKIQKTLNESIDKINKMDPSIESIEDLMAADNYDEFYAIVQKGNSLEDAYKIVNFDKLKNQTIDSTNKEAITKLTSKNHLKTITGNKSDDVLVPDEVLRGYKKNIPGITDEEIKKHYKEFLNNKK